MNIASLVDKDLLTAKGAAVIDVLLLAGIFAAVLLGDEIGRIRLQVIGFIGCAAGLFIAAQSAAFEGPTRLAVIFVGFMLFNFMTNLGPNAQSYLIAGEVFPHCGSRQGCGLRRLVRQDRRLPYGVSVPDCAGRFRDNAAAFCPRRHIAPRGSGDLDVPDLNDGHRPRDRRRQAFTDQRSRASKMKLAIWAS